MGLDVVLFDRNTRKIGLFEIPEPLHHAIFKDTVYWRSYAYLRKISDYYRTDIRLDYTGIQHLVADLRQVRPFVNYHNQRDLDALITALCDNTVCSVHIAGD
jgi:hypothetical protein